MLYLIVGIAVAVLVVVFLLSRRGASSTATNVSPVVDSAAKAAAVVDPSKPTMTVLYGTLSGTSKEFAESIADEGNSYGFNATSIDLENYDHTTALANEKLVVLTLATYGEGDPTPNAVPFVEWLEAPERDAQTLANVNFAVFALGNRLYDKFCAAGKRVDSRLPLLGATRIVERGEGDDDKDIKADFNNWKTNVFWPTVRAQFLGASSSEGEDGLPKEFVPALELSFLSNPMEDGSGTAAVESKEALKTLRSYKGGADGFQPDAKLKAELAPVLVNRELRQDVADGGSTRHIELDISKLRLRYITADNLGVFPRNNHRIAGRMARRLGLHPEAVFEIKPLSDKKKSPIPSPCSVRDALEWYLDICAPPRDKLLSALAQYASDPREKARLTGFATTDKETFLQDHMSLWEVLDEFPSINIPFAALVELTPRLKPRFYTISSSSKLTPTTIALTASLAVLNKPRGRVHYGVTTSYMKELVPGKDKLWVFVQPSSFRLPVPKPVATSNPPIVMVGPGTGIAPFRAFIHDEYALRQERTRRERKTSTGMVADSTDPTERVLGEMTLYFGCRRRNEDFLYHDELQQAAGDRVLTHLQLAFSRESSERKVYVQHLLKARGAETWKDLHERGGYVYVCGATSMGKDVKTELVNLAVEFGQMSQDQAANWLSQLQSSGRYVQELWS